MKYIYMVNWSFSETMLPNGYTDTDTHLISSLLFKQWKYGYFQITKILIRIFQTLAFYFKIGK